MPSQHLDAGSVTAERYRYQAEVSLPFCLACALGDEILCVVPEHHEDLAVETVTGWRFIQVKSRDPELGLWTLRRTLSNHGAFHSLYRTHLATTSHAPTSGASLEMLLEGYVRRGDAIEHLRSDGDHNHPELLTAVMETLEITQEEARAFLGRVVLQKPPPPRSSIRATNLRLLHEQKSSLDHDAVLRIHDALVHEIERAMRAEHPDSSWPEYLANPSTPPETTRAFEAKRLTRDHLRTLIAPITAPPRHILRRLVDRTSSAVSPLERKLRAGGASDEIVEKARELRWNSQENLLRMRTIGPDSLDDRLEDLRFRLETYATAQREVHLGAQRPALAIWTSLLDRLHQHAASIDFSGLVQADPMLLLGEVCELAEMCRVDFGVENAA